MARNTKSRLTHERVCALIDYNPETGIFTSKVDRLSAKAGKVLGTLSPQGYVLLSIDGVTVTAQSLAVFIKTGQWAISVDHHDHDRLNNRWINLRPTTHSLNSANRKLTKRNTSGMPGVRWYNRYGKWVARVCVDGKSVWLGSFDNLFDAAVAYAEAAREAFGEFASPAIEAFFSAHTREQLAA